MSGTDRSRADGVHEGGPAIILIEPQLGENIGMVARAMLNCGLTDLRLVRPREIWPNDKAVAAASGADRVLDKARLFASATDAIADLNHVYATTARPRYMTKRVMTPRQAASELRAEIASGAASGILFGKEAAGLHNDDIALAEAIITVPLNPAFSSLNLGMAVLIVGYEWFAAGDSGAPAAELSMPPETKSGDACRAARPLSAPGGGTRRLRLPAQRAIPAEHGSQPAQPVRPRPPDPAGGADAARRHHLPRRGPPRETVRHQARLSFFRDLDPFGEPDREA